MNKLDIDYINLSKNILLNGSTKKDRTGTGTISVFGRNIRHNMVDGFPLLTTKKLYTKGIIEELLWFLRGETNIKSLVEKNVNIWNGDAYKKYLKFVPFSSTFANDRNISLIKKTEFTYTDELKIGELFNLEQFLEKIKTDDSFAIKYGELGRIYGKQWRDWRGYNQGYKDMQRLTKSDYSKSKGIDQIAVLIDQLNNNPDSRRLMVNSWKVDELEDMTLPPCHYQFQCYTKELTLEEREQLHIKIWGINASDNTHEKYNERNIAKRSLSILWNQRSVDTALGLPFNIASYGFLLCILAKIVNMVPQDLIGNFGDTHIYLNQIDGLQEQLNREPYSLPELELSGTFNTVEKFWVNNKFQLDNFLKELNIEDFKINDYESHPSIKLPLSN